MNSKKEKEMNKLLKVLHNPRIILQHILQFKIFRILPDKLWLSWKYYSIFGKKINWNVPKTFNEKLQWLKLYDHNPIYHVMVDKYEAKEYVSKKIGDQYIIPTYGVWDKFDDIDFENLPNQFVLKCTHDSGGLVICRDKSKLNLEESRKKIEKSLKRNYYWFGREWPYKDVKPRIIAEKYMSDGLEEDIPDYKVHCFNGEPRVILVCRERFADSGLTEDFYTGKWEHIEVKRPGHANTTISIEEPKELQKMLDLARKLSTNIPFVRSDFYTIGNKVFFGELTFYPSSGFAKFEPNMIDDKFGNWIFLPEKSSKGGYIRK